MCRRLFVSDLAPFARIQRLPRTGEQAPEKPLEERQDEVTELILPSEAPKNRRASAMSRGPSMSVKNLLASSVAKSPVPRYSTAVRHPV